MFRGGRVNSYGTGIASGLADGGRVGFRTGGSYLSQALVPSSVTQAYTPRGVPQSFLNFLKGNITSGVGRGPDFRKINREGLASLEDYGVIPKEEVDTFENLNLDTPVTDKRFVSADNIATDANVVDKVEDEQKEIVDTSLGDTGIATETIEDFKEEIPGKKTLEVKTPDPNKTDEAEVTMTDLEKALGLDDAKREYAADALAAASKAFFEGRGFEAISDAAQVKSKAPEIKRLAGLEEFKAKKQKELFDAKERQKRFAPGNVQKTVDYLTAKGISEDEAIKIATKQSPTFAAELSKHTTGNVILPDGFKLAAEIFYGSEYKGNQLTDGDMIIGEKVELENGVYTDKDNKLLFEVEDKKVVRKNSYK
jgi:hypothetical protein